MNIRLQDIKGDLIVYLRLPIRLRMERGGEIQLGAEILKQCPLEMRIELHISIGHDGLW